MLGTVIYLVLRAGMITSSGTGQSESVGFVALATLVGLFSAQAAEKLKQVFEVMLVKQLAANESIATRDGRPADAQATARVTSKLRLA